MDGDRELIHIKELLESILSEEKVVLLPISTRYDYVQQSYFLVYKFGSPVVKSRGGHQGIR